MCILFVHDGSRDPNSEYRLILASNRDEFYDRPAKNMGHWDEDPDIIGGRDLEANCDGGTWLAISPIRKRVGALLNLPRIKNPNAKTRGRVVADYVKSETPAEEYINSIKEYCHECNDFIFVSIDIGSNPSVHSYSNANDKLDTWTDPFIGFGNSLPETPLKKVEAGKEKLKDICSRLNKVAEKKQLIEELLAFLKSEKQHLPDPELKRRRPNTFTGLSSIFVRISDVRYGTRTHTILLVTKGGQADLIEVTLQAPIDLDNPKWERTELQFDVDGSKSVL